MQADFQEGTVSVLAREMSDGRQAIFQNVGDERFRRKGRVAARQVREADNLDDVRRAGRLLDESLGLDHLVIASQH